MNKKGKTDWDEFIRIALGVMSIGIGVGIVGKSAGQIGGIILGFVLIGVGIAVIASKR